MTQMTAAPAADHLRPAQHPALVRPQLDRGLAGRLEETRPARAGSELGVRAEQLVPAAGAAVGAVALGVEVSPGEGLLSVAPAQHVVLLSGQFLPPLLIGLLDLGRRGGLRGPGAAHRRSLPAVALSVLNTPRPGVTGSNKPHRRRHSASRNTGQVTRAGSTCTAGRFRTPARAPWPFRRGGDPRRPAGRGSATCDDLRPPWNHTRLTVYQPCCIRIGLRLLCTTRRTVLQAHR